MRIWSDLLLIMFLQTAAFANVCSLRNPHPSCFYQPYLQTCPILLRRRLHPLQTLPAHHRPKIAVRWVHASGTQLSSLWQNLGLVSRRQVDFGHHA